jgi:hypothetical protein
MSQFPKDEHSSKGVTEYQYLPQLQRQILLYLAENEPQIRYKISKELKCYYKSVCDSIFDLVKKKIIIEIKKGESNNNLYWLTPAGVFIALVQGANPKAVLNRTNEVYPENKMLQCVVEITTILGTDAYKIGYQAILKKGKLDNNDISLIFSTALSNELSLEQITMLIDIMKKYPEQYSDLKEQTFEAIEKMKKVELFLKHAFDKNQGVASVPTPPSMREPPTVSKE